MLNLLVSMLTKSNKNRALETVAILSSYTAQILSRQKYAKIHSVFPNGFNLDFKGSLVYMTYHQEGQLSAVGLTIDRKIFNQIHPQLQIGQLVRLRDNRFTFYIQANTLTLTMKEQVLKDLKLANHSIKNEQWLQLKNQLVKKDLLKSSGFFTREILMDTYEDIYQNKSITSQHVQALIGAGIGLTPTGDDFLQGLILMEKMLGNEPTIEQEVKKQLKKRSTTDVSLSYYRAIFDGYYNEPLAQLFEAMSQGDEQQMNDAISLVQDYGETSGFDLLTGMLTYLQITKE